VNAPNAFARIGFLFLLIATSKLGCRSLCGEFLDTRLITTSSEFDTIFINAIVVVAPSPMYCNIDFFCGPISRHRPPVKVASFLGIYTNIS
jgi:hypothetical protein